MPASQSIFHLAPNIAVHFKWSAHTTTFTQEWQRRLQTVEVSGTQAEEHVIEAASMVLSTVEHLDDYTAQVLTDLYCLSGQLLASTDKLLVGPLELRVEERQFAVSHQEGIAQMAITYYFDIVRYRYETAQLVSSSATSFPLPA